MTCKDKRQTGHPLLFDAYPGLRQTLPWQPLAVLPTACRPLNRLGGGSLWIKRDDLNSEIYGGNKIRKLEFLLADARRRGARRLITVGGIGTNHGLATAVYCRQLGIRCTLLLYRQPVTANVIQNLKLFVAHGAILHYHPNLLRAMLAYYLWMRLRHPGAYFVYPGGSDPLGTIGFVNAAFELARQIEQGELPAPAAVICPFGSGGTLAGLALGARMSGLEAEIVGVRVIASHLGAIAAATPDSVTRLMSRTLALLRRCDPRIPNLELKTPKILNAYFGRGYGVPTTAGRLAARRFRDLEGIELEPTYTAKTAAAVLDMCRQQPGTAGPVLYWHTYNSVDLSPVAAAVDVHRLPLALQPFLKEEPAHAV